MAFVISREGQGEAMQGDSSQSRAAGAVTVADQLAADFAKGVKAADLIGLPVLARCLMDSSGCSVASVAAAVVGRLEGRPEGELHLMEPGADPCRVEPGRRFPPPRDEGRRVLSRGLNGGTVHSPRGLSAVEWLKAVWPNCRTTDQLAWDLGGRLAVTRATAAEVFGVGGDGAAQAEATQPQASTTAAQARAELSPSTAGAAAAEGTVQPKGGAWPHVPGAEWTHAERDAMFEMRHRGGLTNKAIAKVAELNSDQIVTQQIGGKADWKRADWHGGGGGWKPSAELLARCGLEKSSALKVVKTGC